MAPRAAPSCNAHTRRRGDAEHVVAPEDGACAARAVKARAGPQNATTRAYWWDRPAPCRGRPAGSQREGLRDRPEAPRRAATAAGARPPVSPGPPDAPGVVALPPLIYGVPWLVGAALHLLFPVHLLPPALAHWGGGVACTAAVALAIWGRLAMARAGTDPNPFHPATALVVEGPFRFSRNPLYGSLTLFYLGLTLVVNALWPLVFLPAVLFVIERGVVEREERYMERKFGDAYRAYRTRVRRWL
jgi:protein-S-isoprenylcysteine O-methyltransferase Ste14